MARSTLILLPAILVAFQSQSTNAFCRRCMCSGFMRPMRTTRGFGYCFENHFARLAKKLEEMEDEMMKVWDEELDDSSKDEEKDAPQQVEASMDEKGDKYELTFKFPEAFGDLGASDINVRVKNQTLFIDVEKKESSKTKTDNAKRTSFSSRSFSIVRDFGSPIDEEGTTATIDKSSRTLVIEILKEKQNDGKVAVEEVNATNSEEK